MQLQSRQNVEAIIERMKEALAARGLKVNDISHLFSQQRVNLKRLLKKRQILHSNDEMSAVAKVLGISEQWLLYGMGSCEITLPSHELYPLPVCDYCLENTGTTILYVPLHLDMSRYYKGVVFCRENEFVPSGTLVIYCQGKRDLHPGLYMAKNKNFFFPIQKAAINRVFEQADGYCPDMGRIDYQVIGCIELVLPLSSFTDHA